MANRYVRLHNKPEVAEPATLIGLSRSAAYVDIANHESWLRFFTSNDYTVREMTPENELDVDTIKAIGGISYRYFEIQPPIKDKHLAQLGALCTETVDVGHNGGYLIDDRNTPVPLETMDERGPIIHYWY